MMGLYLNLKVFSACLLVVFLNFCSAFAVDFNGKFVQGGLIWGKVEAGSAMKLDGVSVKVGTEGHFVFGFSREAKNTSQLLVTYPDGREEEIILTIQPRKFNIERVNGLPPKTVTPPPEWSARRKIETGRVRSARAHNTDDLNWAWGFTKPAEGRFSGFYGSQRILNGEPRSPHYGLDIAAKVGTPIYAPAGGVVRLAASDFLLEGGIVIIDHGFGVTSTLFHMNSVDVKEGSRLVKGDLIGTIGDKGRASGPHVDWRLNWKSVRLDPGLLIGVE